MCMSSLTLLGKYSQQVVSIPQYDNSHAAIVDEFYINLLQKFKAKDL